jgi:glc operon protein GlcG
VKKIDQNKEATMRNSWALGLTVAGVVSLMGSAWAQNTSPRDVVADTMSFNIPYGAPIDLVKADAAINAAVSEGQKHHWPVNIAVVDSGGNLVAFKRMDGAQLGSIQVSQHKAHAALAYRRETKLFENGIQDGNVYMMTLDGVIGSRGGIPLVVDGKIVGAIGCSGASGAQDEVICKAGAATVK